MPCTPCPASHGMQVFREHLPAGFVKSKDDFVSEVVAAAASMPDLTQVWGPSSSPPLHGARALQLGKLSPSSPILAQRKPPTPTP